MTKTKIVFNENPKLIQESEGFCFGQLRFNKRYNSIDELWRNRQIWIVIGLTVF